MRTVMQKLYLYTGTRISKSFRNYVSVLTPETKNQRRSFRSWRDEIPHRLSSNLRKISKNIDVSTISTGQKPASSFTPTWIFSGSLSLSASCFSTKESKLLWCASKKFPWKPAGKGRFANLSPSRWHDHAPAEYRSFRKACVCLKGKKRKEKRRKKEESREGGGGRRSWKAPDPRCRKCRGCRTRTKSRTRRPLCETYMCKHTLTHSRAHTHTHTGWSLLEMKQQTVENSRLIDTQSLPWSWWNRFS